MKLTWRQKTVNDVLSVGGVSVPEYRVEHNPHEVDTCQLQVVPDVETLPLSHCCLDLYLQGLEKY